MTSNAENRIAHDVGIMSRVVSPKLIVRNAQSAARQADVLLARFMHVEKDGSLARCVRVVVATNRRKATTSNPAV